MSERGISISHTTIMRWVHEFSPEIAKKVHPHLKPVNDSWRVDETYIKVKECSTIIRGGPTHEYWLILLFNITALSLILYTYLQTERDPQQRTVDLNLYILKGVEFYYGLDSLTPDEKLISF